MWYLVTKSMARASFGITTDITYQSHSGSGSGFVSKFSFLPYFVNSAHRGMYNTSKEICVQGLDFIFLHLRALSNLWGRYDPKSEKKLTFLLVIVSFLLIESSVIPALKALWRASFLLPTLMSYEQYMRTLWPKSIKIWWFNRVLCSLIRLSVLRDLSLKPWANQHMLTFKVKVKVKLESFYSCLQL